MGMFDSLYVKKANTMIEIQTKQLEQSMDRYYWGDQITKDKGVTFLVEDFAYSKSDNYNDWFIFVLLNGFYVDFAVVNQEKYIPYTKKQLSKIWNNLELQNFMLSSLLEQNYNFSQQKSYLINSLSQKVAHYSHYLKEPVKNKDDKFNFNFNLYQDKNVSIEDFLNELKNSIDEKQKQIYGNQDSYQLVYDDTFQNVSDVGQMQHVQQAVKQFIYLNKEKLHFSSDEIVLSHMLQPLILSSNIDLNQKILFHLDDIESLPTYFDYSLCYIKLSNDVFQAMIDKHWTHFTYEQKANILSSNLIDDYHSIHNYIIDKYTSNELEQIAHVSSFWQELLSEESSLLINTVFEKLQQHELILKDNKTSILGAFIEGIIGSSGSSTGNNSNIKNIDLLTKEMIDLMEQQQRLYLSVDVNEENDIWQRSILAQPKLEEMKSYYESRRLEEKISPNFYKSSKTLKL